jgi:hypothetical protein
MKVKLSIPFSPERLTIRNAGATLELEGEAAALEALGRIIIDTVWHNVTGGLPDLAGGLAGGRARALTEAFLE